MKLILMFKARISGNYIILGLGPNPHGLTTCIDLGFGLYTRHYLLLSLRNFKMLFNVDTLLARQHSLFLN